MDLVAISAMLLIFVVREITHYKQDIRRDALISELTDKLKASSFTEYVEAKQEPQTFEPVSNDDTTLYYKEIEEMKQ